MGESSRNALDDCLLIGVDGGATEVKAHAVSRETVDGKTVYRLREQSASRVYERIEGFVPTPVTEQLAQRDSGSIQLTDGEREQGRRWVDAARDAIAQVAESCAAGTILFGMGMPGLKTSDQRGINVINNGPRIPDFLDQLETRLKGVGIALAAPAPRLGSDADYCGMGEQHADRGAFSDVANAYYVGCGTGIADALKLRHALVPFDQTKNWLQKSWQIPSSLGPTYEKLVSASQFNDVYRRMIASEGACDPAFPELAAIAGDLLAESWLDTTARLMAELIFERIDTIHNGRSENARRGDAYNALNPDHPYRGFVLDRVVIGQRLGQIYADRRFELCFAVRLNRYLAEFIKHRGVGKMSDAYVVDGSLRYDLVVASQLRAAPALGAAIDAAKSLM